MYAIIRHTKSTSSLRSLHGHSSSPHACATFVLNNVLCSTRLKPFCSSQVVFTPMDPDIAPDSPGGCTGHDPVLAPGSPAARKRKPRRLREEGAVGVAIMISDTRGLWHADMLRSAAARPRGAKSATGVLGLVLTKWRLASTDAGKNEALGSHELERRRLQAGTLSRLVEYLCLATASGVECRVVLASRVTSHSNDLNANKKNGQQPQPGKKGPVKTKKTHKLESYHRREFVSPRNTSCFLRHSRCPWCFLEHVILPACRPQAGEQCGSPVEPRCWAEPLCGFLVELRRQYWCRQ